MAKIRVPIKITVFSLETGQITKCASSRLKTKSLSNAAKLLKEYPVSKYLYEATLFFSKDKESTTSFGFTTAAELSRHLTISLELSFLKELLKCKMLDKDCIR